MQQKLLEELLNNEASRNDESLQQLASQVDLKILAFWET